MTTIAQVSAATRTGQWQLWRAPVIHNLCLVIAMALGVATVSATASRAQDFYAGRTINIIVSGGGIYESYARMFAAAMPKYIPGRPSMIVQQMTGGGGIRAGNYMHSIAAKDGTVIAGTHGNVLSAALLAPGVVEFDVTRFSWIGNATRDTYLVYVWHNAPIKTLADAKTTEVIMGGTSVGGAGIDMAIFARDLLGFKIKIVSGYKASTETKIAMERGEIHGTMANAISSLYSTDWMATGKVRILAQHANKPSRHFPDVPLFRDFVTNDSHRRLLDLLSVRDDVSKPYFAPAGIPPERLAILRQAFEASLRDSGFLAEAQRQQLEIVDPLTGEQLAETARRIAATPPSLAQQLVDLFNKYKDAGGR